MSDIARPEIVSYQCPSCNAQTTAPRCHYGRTRGYQNNIGEYYRQLDCPLWEPIKKEVTVELEKCPTCGQVLRDRTIIKMEDDAI